MTHPRVIDVPQNGVFVLYRDLENSLELYLPAFLEKLALGQSLLQTISQLGQMLASSLEADKQEEGEFNAKTIELPVYYRGIRETKRRVISPQVYLFCQLPDEQRRFLLMGKFDLNQSVVILGQLQG